MCQTAPLGLACIHQEWPWVCQRSGQLRHPSWLSQNCMTKDNSAANVVKVGGYERRPQGCITMAGQKRSITVSGWALYGVGMAIWIVGYYVPGHQSLLQWPAFSPTWIAMFLRNLECELGLVLTTLGSILIYGAKFVPSARMRFQ